MSLPKKEILADGRSVTIYALYGEDVLPRYIGKTVRSPEWRLMNHLVCAKKRRYPIERWLYKHRGEKILIDVLEVVPANKDWQLREKHWIKYYRDCGARLLNITDGGEGHHGRKLSKSHRKKISDAIRTGFFRSCLTCGDIFWVKPCVDRVGDGKYCSRKCYHAPRKGKTKQVSQVCKEKGVAAAALAKKSRTHCRYGHPLSGANLYIQPANGGRVCVECRKRHKRAYRARRISNATA